MREPKGPPESGNTLAEMEEGDDNDTDCMCRGMRRVGEATRAGGETQAGGAAWVGDACVGDAWAGALPWGPPVPVLRVLEHWRRLSVRRALRVCQIALRLRMGRYRPLAYD
jgi:hypothetical protein